ncbi:DUF2971 domain-containing protein [Gemmatimonas sp.]|uniref:DUF2971 domain-containing protein n=1 Tax=Gemmatimonas sp. TaxID=1962908 RepID=UPI003DA39418
MESEVNAESAGTPNQIAQSLNVTGQRHLLERLVDGLSLPDFLYHYTSPGGLHGILRSRSIWATDVRFLNDAKEAQYAIEIVKARIKAKSSEFPRDLERRWNRALAVASETRAYVTCFSMEGDSLSQWRAYAKAGYALGFATPSIAETARNQSVRTHLLPCIYSSQSQIEQVDYMLDYLSEQHKGAVASGHLEPVSLHAHEASFYGFVMILSASFKHPKFKDEKEWRLVQVPMDVEAGKAGRQVRDGGRWLVPYRSVHLHEPCLREIVIGPSPHRDLATESVRILVDEEGIQCEEYRPSEIPYRDW